MEPFPLGFLGFHEKVSGTSCHTTGGQLCFQPRSHSSQQWGQTPRHSTRVSRTNKEDSATQVGDPDPSKGSTDTAGQLQRAEGQRAGPRYTGAQDAFQKDSVDVYQYLERGKVERSVGEQRMTTTSSIVRTCHSVPAPNSRIPPGNQTRFPQKALRPLLLVTCPQALP